LMTIDSDEEVMLEIDMNTIILERWRWEMYSVVGEMQDKSSVFSSQVIFTRNLGQGDQLVRTVNGTQYLLFKENRSVPQ
jgi:hypothetical protein